MKMNFYWLPGISKGERYKSDSYPPIHQIAHAVSLNEKRSKFAPLSSSPLQPSDALADGTASARFRVNTVAHPISSTLTSNTELTRGHPKLLGDRRRTARGIVLLSDRQYIGNAADP